MNAANLAALVVRLRWAIIAIYSAVTLFFALQLPKIEMDVEMKNQLPSDLPTRVNLSRIEELFGGTDMAMIVLSTDDVLAPTTLQRLKALTDEMDEIDELQRIVGLFKSKDLRSEDGEMIVDDAVPSVPQSDAEREALRERLKKNPLVYGNLISEDFKHAVLIGFLDPKASDAVVVNKLNELTESIKGPETTYVGGMPVTRVSLTQDMRKDMRRFLPIGLALMVVFLFACFRQARGVVLPFLMTVMAIVVSMGLIPLLGWKLYTVTILLPVILLAVANDYGIHIVARYQEDNAPNTNHTPHELARRGVVGLGRPVFATAITTAVGMLCLMSHIIIPAKQLGVLAAVGVLFALASSLMFIPALLAIMPKANPIHTAESATETSKVSGLDRLLGYFGRAVTRAPKPILVGFVLVAAVVGLGSLRVVVDTNPMGFYERSEPIWRSTHLLNEKLGGWAGVSVVAEGDIKDPAVLKEIDALEQHLKQHPLVGTTTSIAGVLRKMNMVMHDNDPAYDRIPETREAVAQYFLLYSMSGDPSDFEKLVDFDYQHAQLMAKITDSGTRAATDVLAYTRDFIQQRPETSLTMVGGLLDVMADMVHHIVWGQVVSMLLASVLVCAMVCWLLRSFVCGVMALFPVLLALAILFGIMGLFGIELNLITALLSSIMIGVGIDYSIHFLWRYREERQAGLTAETAVERTLITTGRGIVFNGLSVVIGFVVLVVSAFFPVRFFGILVSISILASLAGALVVLPAILLVFRPRYFEPKGSSVPVAPLGSHAVT